MRKLILTLLFAALALGSVSGRPGWTNILILESGDRIVVSDSSGAIIVYTVPVAGTVNINDGNHPIKSSMFYGKERAGGVTTYFFQGQMKAAASVADIQASPDHETIGHGADGASLAGAAAITLSASTTAADAVVLAEVATAIGTVALEFFPATAMGVGLGVTAYYVYRGVTDWLKDVRYYARGIEAFGEYVTKKWLYARAAVVFTATAQLLMELEDMTDEELVEVVDALWVSDDIERIRDFMNDPDPEDNRAKIIKKIILGGITFAGIQTLTKLAESYSDDLKKIIDEMIKRWEKNRRRVILICEDDPGEIPLFSFLIPENVRDAYDLEYVKTTEGAEIFITTRGDEIAAIILDGKMPSENTGFATRRLLPLIEGGIPIIGNSDSRETQSLMSETGRFFYICQEKTGDLPKVPWDQILPLLE